MSSLKSSEHIQKKGCGPDRHVSDNQSSSVTLNELATKVRKFYFNFKFQQTSHIMTDINPNEVQMFDNLGSDHRRSTFGPTFFLFYHLFSFSPVL